MPKFGFNEMLKICECISAKCDEEGHQISTPLSAGLVTNCRMP